MTGQTLLAKSWLAPGIEAGSSLIEATGLFATTDFPRGAIVFRFGGHVVANDFLDSLETYSSLAVTEWTSLLQDDDDPARFGNHSCDSNLWMTDAVTAVAKRNIAAGEELTLDYALISSGEEWTMDCRCGAPVCRGVISADDWRREDVQERYAGHFSPFINARIAASRP